MHFWNVGGTNDFVPGTFDGVGYVRTVLKAKTNADGSIPRDKQGRPIFTPTKEEIH